MGHQSKFYVSYNLPLFASAHSFVTYKKNKMTCADYAVHSYSLYATLSTLPPPPPSIIIYIQLHAFVFGYDLCPKAFFHSLHISKDVGH